MMSPIKVILNLLSISLKDALYKPHRVFKYMVGS